MKVQISEYINKTDPLVKKLVQVLSERFEGVSVLATDCQGKKLGGWFFGYQCGRRHAGRAGFCRPRI